MPARPACVGFTPSAISRAELFSALLIAASVNGLAPRIVACISDNGWLYGLFNTFDVSVIVWGALAAACYFAFQTHNAEPLRRLDLLIACVVIVLVALPVTSLSWVSLSLISAYIFWTSPSRSSQRRSAMIFFAICVPMFWGPLLLTVAAQPLLRIDAFLVGALAGTEGSGNLVQTADGVHRLIIGAGCSSFHNISQAGLAWVALSQALGREWGLRELFWCALAVASAAAVNLGRLSLLAIYFENFDTIHGPVGAQIAGGLTFALIILVCMFGLRRELFARA